MSASTPEAVHEVLPDGSPLRLSGRGIIVSRRRPDGTWGIVLDDPLSAA